MNNLINAINIAYHAHELQVDKDSKPYILHPLRVMLNSKMETEIHQICAILHDVMEDHEIYTNIIKRDFSNLVYQTLLLLTHFKAYSYLDYIKKIKDSGSNIAITIKIADIEDNLNRIYQLKNEETKTRLHKKYLSSLDILKG